MDKVAIWSVLALYLNNRAEKCDMHHVLFGL